VWRQSTFGAERPVVPRSANAVGPLMASPQVHALHKPCGREELARPIPRRMPRQSHTAGFLPARAAARRDDGGAAR
jgi:hypothetical protein